MSDETTKTTKLSPFEHETTGAESIDLPNNWGWPKPAKPSDIIRSYYLDLLRKKYPDYTENFLGLMTLDPDCAFEAVLMFLDGQQIR